MKIKINFIDSIIDFDNSNIYSFELYNKKYLYRISELFYKLSIGELVEEIKLFKGIEEISLSNKVKFFANYFDFDYMGYSTELLKHIIKNIETYNYEEIMKQYYKLIKKIKSELLNLELPIKINECESIGELLKSTKPFIEKKDSLLENLLLLIDIEKELNLNHILVFINLKNYLSEMELTEFYKYVIYNNAKVIMIDLKKQLHIKNYEKVIIIDENLDENMI